MKMFMTGHSVTTKLENQIHIICQEHVLFLQMGQYLMKALSLGIAFQKMTMPDLSLLQRKNSSMNVMHKEVS
ncbi:hypothetical protein ID866_3531 [Astraeus odoratus]|nr:hypothetical protein ID866_3531 [Astraeus odoratus]